jgi:hypothetical protein
MPNWCSNHITVRGTDPVEIEILSQAFADSKFCNAVSPIPEELNNPDTGSFGGDGAEDKDQRRAELTAKYGYSGWYDWCVANWGTKWDIGDDSNLELDEDGLGFSGSFDSAWSPPIGVMEALTEQGFEVTLYYYEPGIGFCGKWHDGDDEWIEYAGETSETVRAAIGDELDDMFGISESMAECEAENPEEELTEWIKDGIESKNENT